MTNIILDVHHLNIIRLTGKVAGGVESSLAYEVKPFQSFGSALHIDVAPLALSAGATTALTVHYSASAGPALCWLEPEQTAGKTHPYLFTQGQACLNRSLFPCVDSPSQRLTWDATFLVDTQLVAVASAIRAAPAAIADGAMPVGDAVTPDGAEFTAIYPSGAHDAASGLPQLDPATLHAFRYTMAQSVPSYLVAFAVGNLRCAGIGPRSAVWSEPELIEKAKHEFGAHGVTESYVAAGEAMFGPYRWGRYDILCCPPSFPFGGMEK